VYGRLFEDAPWAHPAGWSSRGLIEKRREERGKERMKEMNEEGWALRI